jgi:hypothetical protein
MPSAQAAISLGESVRPRALPSIVQHQDVLHALVPCFPPYEKSAEVYIQNGRKFTGKQQTLQEFWKVSPEHSASV